MGNIYNLVMTHENHPSNASYEENSRYEYAAFISYRHVPRDQALAKQIQQAIETFRLPRGIRAHNRTDNRLGRCFRDEDELSAAHSLPDRIVDALSKSAALIVVCSPEARDSVWINREIAAFIELHGRERVFAVLAYGSTAESIPAALQTQTAVPGSAGVATSNPLAADLRPEASGKKRDEMLRIIAAIADCRYDDLRQRNKARSIKRGIAIAVAAVFVIAAIAATLTFASSSRQDALAAESRQLAAESSQLLARGDRYGAIEKALQALPRSESSADRPIVPEARSALEDALDINANPNSAWWASYEITTPAPLGLLDDTLAHTTGVEIQAASAIAVSNEGGFFALSDAEGTVSVYDTLTGKKLANCVMPKEAQPFDDGMYRRSMAATKNYLLVSNVNDDTSVLACFDVRTGDLAWSSRDGGYISFDTSYGADLLSMVRPLAEGGYGVTIADIATSQSSSTVVDDIGLVDASTPYYNTPGAVFGINYAAFGNVLYSVQLDSGETNHVSLAYAEVTSLAYLDGLVVVTSADHIPSGDVTRRYAIEAFDENLVLKWRQSGTFTSEMIVDSGITSLLSAEPQVHGAIGVGDDVGIVVSAGRQVVVLNPSDGALICSFPFDQSIAGVGMVDGAQSGPGYITIACSNGVVNCVNATNAQDATNDARRLQLHFPIRWAYITHCAGYDVVLAVPADADNRIVAYRTDWTRGEETGSQYSLDELRELANHVLTSGGRV